MSDCAQGGRALVTPERPHSCSPGWEWRWFDGDEWLPAGRYGHQLDLPAGTVWECDCGQVYIAEAWPRGKDMNVLMHRIDWRPERRRERRRRMKNSRSPTPACPFCNGGAYPVPPTGCRHCGGTGERTTNIGSSS